MRFFSEVFGVIMRSPPRSTKSRASAASAGYKIQGKENSELGLEVLNGRGRKAIVEAVCLNAGAVLYISGKARNIQAGYELAKKSIADGTALRKLEEVKRVSNSL